MWYHAGHDSTTHSSPKHSPPRSDTKFSGGEKRSMTRQVCRNKEPLQHVLHPVSHELEGVSRHGSSPVVPEVVLVVVVEVDGGLCTRMPRRSHGCVILDGTSVLADFHRVKYPTITSHKLGQPTCRQISCQRSVDTDTPLSNRLQHAAQMRAGTAREWACEIQKHGWLEHIRLEHMKNNVVRF